MDIDAIDIVYKSPKLIVKEDGKLKVLSKRLETFFEQDPDINRNANIKKSLRLRLYKNRDSQFFELKHQNN